MAMKVKMWKGMRVKARTNLTLHFPTFAVKFIEIDCRELQKIGSFFRKKSIADLKRLFNPRVLFHFFLFLIKKHGIGLGVSSLFKIIITIIIIFLLFCS